jgi:hypothetical protein
VLSLVGSESDPAFHEIEQLLQGLLPQLRDRPGGGTGDGIDAASADQALASTQPLRNPPTIAVHRSARLGMVLPVPSSAIGFRDVAADAHGFEIDERLIAVIALVADDFFDTVSVGLYRLDLLGRFNQCLAARRCVSLIVRPSFILVIFASGSCGWVQSSFEPLFFRFRSIRARSARVGVSMPDACASFVRKS